jgi:hypothetical protein
VWKEANATDCHETILPKSQTEKRHFDQRWKHFCLSNRYFQLCKYDEERTFAAEQEMPLLLIVESQSLSEHFGDLCIAAPI